MPRIYKSKDPYENKAVTPEKENKKQEPKMPKPLKDDNKKDDNEQ